VFSFFRKDKFPELFKPPYPIRMDYLLLVYDKLGLSNDLERLYAFASFLLDMFLYLF